MAFWFDTIHFCVYNKLMPQENVQVQKNRLDHKFASYVFMVIIFFSAVWWVVVGSIAQNSGVDLSDFWENSVSLIVMYGLFLAAFYICCSQLRVKKGNVARTVDLKLKEVSFWNMMLMVLLALLILGSYMLVVQGAVDIFTRVGYTPASGTGPQSIPQYFMAVLVLCLLPAVIEELLFRGLILKGLMSMGKVVAVLGSALLFSLFHSNPDQTIFTFILGVVFALVVLKTGNLLYAMILHFLNNFAVITTYTFVGDVTLIRWGFGTVALAVLLAVVGSLMIVGVYKTLKPKPLQNDTPKTAKFWSFDNLGFFIAVMLGVSIWAMVFATRF
jgi:membrane protease YdiL (CAAX protease family)